MHRKPVYRLPLWIFGFVLILLGSILDLVAFGFAPQSLLAPLGMLILLILELQCNRRIDPGLEYDACTVLQ